MDLPQYQCHKRVRAAKIRSVEYEAMEGGVPDPRPAAGVLVFDGPPEAFELRWKFSGEWGMKHTPKVGGYLVIYDDGYASFSPAEAFDTGYTLIPTGTLAR